MAAWVTTVIERLPRRALRVVIAATALLLLAGAITSLTLETNEGGNAHRLAPPPATPLRRTSTSPSRPSARLPVSASELDRAGWSARWFLLSYLKFAYGRAGGTSVKAITTGLRGQLIRETVRVTPVERGRHPRVVSLHMVGTTPGFVVATAAVEDGGVAAYRLRFTMQEQAGRWLVSGVQEG